jgi:hypothetical protein
MESSVSFCPLHLAEGSMLTAVHLARLEDGHLLADYGLVQDSMIQLVLKLRGCACGCKQIPWVIEIEAGPTVAAQA